ncbi:MAG: threonine-phosphate decarboxylase [Elusimicrobia bacterium]|nr:threonine-phosphate decarboxylase [Elusimicrobiota bacterium]
MSHGGDWAGAALRTKRPPRAFTDFSANINPFGLPRAAGKALEAALRDIGRYPDPHCGDFRRAAADRHRVRPDEILPGNGAAELIHLAARALRGRPALILSPSFSEYASACAIEKTPVSFIHARSNGGFPLDTSAVLSAIARRRRCAVWAANPNNPTGRLLRPAWLASLVRVCRAREHTLILDEAFLEFSRGGDGRSWAARAPRQGLLVLRSLTKSFAVPGLRVGYAVGPKFLLDALKRFQPPWSVNALAQAAGVALLSQDGFLRRSRERVAGLRAALSAALAELGFIPYPSDANFLLCRVPEPGPAASWWKTEALARGLLLRSCEDFPGLEDGRHVRFAVRTAPENKKLIAALGSIAHGR